MESKKKYIAPCIEWIQLDNQISLALESSTPPEGPGETVQNAMPDYFNGNIFKTNLG